MSQRSQDRFVPSGVNAESWLGFELRIRERRFRALLDSAREAIAGGDAVAARVALEEARELRPEAAELNDLEDALAALPLPAAAVASPMVWSRAVGAVMLLLVGIGLLVGLDWLRRPVAPVAVPVATAPDMRMASPVVATPPVVEQVPVTIVPPPAADQLVPEATTATSGEADVARGIRDVSVPTQPTYRQASTRALPPDGEVPDDYVFSPPARRQLLLPPPAAAPVSRAATAAPAPRPGPPATAAPPTTVADETRVAAVLNQYVRAYTQLDAGAARAVWPTVDERALARAFAGLASQDLAFDDCAIDVRGTTANAACRGTASYVGKVGSREPRTEPRTWRFELRRDGEAWTIASAEAQRQ